MWHTLALDLSMHKDLVDDSKHLVWPRKVLVDDWKDLICITMDPVDDWKDPV
jgi:hypothetical protein